MTDEQRFVTNEMIDLISHWKQTQSIAEKQIEYLQDQLSRMEDVLEVPEEERRGRRP